jgi:hypothetical protein
LLHQLKPCFRNKPSIFCYQPSVVDMFIKHHLSVNVDDKVRCINLKYLSFRM